MSGITDAEHHALRDITTNGVDKYRRVTIDGETIPGSDVLAVMCPDRDCPYWLIQLKSGTVYRATNATIVENAQ